MGKFSPRTLLWGVFCVWVTVILSGCVQSLGLDSFVKDDEVQEIIEKSAGTVFVEPGSAPGVVGGNKKISGLSLGEYYMVEIWDDQGEFDDVYFVTANGKLSSKGGVKGLTDIGRVTVREIGELVNNYHYRVTTTKTVLNDVPYTALNPPASIQGAENDDGLITLHGPEDGFIIYTLIPPIFIPLEGIVEIPFDPPAPASNARRSQTGEIITLIGYDTVTDYIFYGYSSLDAGINFHILRVASDKVENPPKPGGGGTGNLIITVNLTLSADDSPQITIPDSTPPVTYPQGGTGTIQFTVSNASQYTGIIWYVDGEQVETGATFNLNKEQVEYKLVGVYTITVEATKDGKPYSAAIEVTVSP